MEFAIYKTSEGLAFDEEEWERIKKPCPDAYVRDVKTNDIYPKFYFIKIGSLNGLMRFTSGAGEIVIHPTGPWFLKGYQTIEIYDDYRE